MASTLSGTNMPQPATFAPSKDDILGALGFYFGQPVSPEKLKDYNEHHAATYHFPGTHTAHSSDRQHGSWSTARVLTFVFVPYVIRRCLCRFEHKDPRHDQQPRREAAPDLAHDHRPSLPPHRGHGTHPAPLPSQPTRLRSDVRLTTAWSLILCSQVVEWDEIRFDVRLMQRVPVC